MLFDEEANTSQRYSRDVAQDKQRLFQRADTSLRPLAILEKHRWLFPRHEGGSAHSSPMSHRATGRRQFTARQHRGKWTDIPRAPRRLHGWANRPPNTVRCVRGAVSTSAATNRLHLAEPGLSGCGSEEGEGADRYPDQTPPFRSSPLPSLPSPAPFPGHWRTANTSCELGGGGSGV